ncbi:glutathione peroxidase [Coralloluteibacterium thermophilus]|uniref:Glutathione peroxidase n=1 Tax=Coralloluteibacterium thermophilum TaxID=2707049 RepID=A0ABV9NMX1_9GAMM
MRRLVLVLVLFVAAVAPSSAAKLLDVSLRPLAQRDAVNLQERFAGQVLLIVNTASKCGFTPQYEGLEALHQRHAERGFAVLGFPSNDFLGQEPGTEEEIQAFCTLTYGVGFPMFEKVQVKGEDAHPLYRELARQGGEAPGWNFHKYLVGRDGRVRASFGSRVRPDDRSLAEAIEAALAEPVR